MTANELRAGQRVAVVQQIPQRDDVWTSRVEGTIVRVEQRKTGSWYAHSKDHKLWLDRLVLKKDDGEVVVCNLDRFTHVDVEEEPEPASSPGDAGKAEAREDERRVIPPTVKETSP